MLKVLVPLALIVMMVSTVYAAPPTLLWSDAVETSEIDVSKDGNYAVSAVRAGGINQWQVRFYSRSSGTPIWISNPPEETQMISVAISADGDCVVAGSSSFGAVWFFKGARTLTGNPPPTWVSEDLHGTINRGCLDISDDGNYVVACGAGKNVLYWRDARSKSGGYGANIPPTWQKEIGTGVYSADLSSDGDYVAAGYSAPVTDDMSVAYWKNARTLSGTPAPDWSSTEPDQWVSDIAVSDDGNYVAAACGVDTVYYWANAKSLGGNPPTKWWYGVGVSFSSIAMSSDGDKVVAGAEYAGKGVYFWSGARGLSGKPQAPTWTYTTTGDVHDVAIDATGAYMAAVNDEVSPHYVYFLNSGGTLLWSFELPYPSYFLSISSDGSTLAVQTYESPETGYLFDTGYTSAPRPVGGVAIPTNKLEILAPYLALVGLIAAVFTVVVVKRRRD